MDEIVFDKAYYDRVIKEFGYDPLRFGRITFSLGDLGPAALQLRWLCHDQADIFAARSQKGGRSIVTTGFGMSGVPHAGTLSEILRAVTLQKAGLPVQIVLGDLDAYNGKGRPLEQALELAEQYKAFCLRLGFDATPPSVIRSQHDHLDVLRTAYLIGYFMDDALFNEAEEDLHSFYTSRGQVDHEMTYRRKLSLNLMIADFIHLFVNDGFDNVLVTLGLDEHKYVRAAIETISRMTMAGRLSSDTLLAGMYSPLNKGFNGYPKMSKSFSESSVHVDMTPSDIHRRITGEARGTMPETDVVYQLMSSASYFTEDELRDMHLAFRNGGPRWEDAKRAYADLLIDICSKWPA